MLYRLSKPNIPIDSIEKAIDVIKSGFLVQGKNVLDFEEKLKQYLGVKNAIVVSNGTAALHLALIALDIKKGDEVIVPAFTFPATANVVELVGAKPIFVDISLKDFCIDVKKIEEKITSRTKAIMPVHEFGQSADILEIKDLAKKYNLFLIEDAACALGTEYENKKIGQFGDLTCFSFHPRKAITTGEGGLVVTENDDWAEKIRILRNHGICSKNGKIDFKYAGFNYRMTDFQAVLGIAQLANLDSEIEHRIKIAQRYNELLSQNSLVELPTSFENKKNVFQTYHLIINKSINRDDLIRTLKANEIECNYGAYALNLLEFYKNKYSLKENDFPNAEIAYSQGLAMPIGLHISDKDVLSIVNKLNSNIK